MMTSTWRRWLRRLSPTSPGGRRHARPPRSARLRLERLEDRTVPTVSILNNGGNGYVGLTLDKTGPLDGGFIPPDTQGAAGPSSYVQTANLTVGIFTPRDTGTTQTLDSLAHFMRTVGGLPAVGGFGLSDPVIVYDEYIGRFIVAVQDTGSGPNALDIATSKSNNPTDLTASNWTFAQITTTEGTKFADYPGNMGYNADALVVTLNMFSGSVISNVQVTAISTADLAAGSGSPTQTHTDLSGVASLRPATMHSSSSGDPMWLVSETGDGSHITVWQMSSPLSSPVFTPNTVAVTPYFGVVAPLNPNGTAITTNIDSRIQKVSYNIVGGVPNLVAAQAVSNAAGDRDLIQWYRMTISGSTPTLQDQGQVDSGPGTYNVYPALDITTAGTIGMDYTHSGTDTATDFMSGYITGRLASDPAGTMETPVLIPAATGTGNEVGGREGDLSGINIDPTDNSTFWATQEFATFSTMFGNYYWGEAGAHFGLSTADLALTGSGTATATEGDNNLTYTFTVTNGGPDDATSTVLTDTLGTSLKFVNATTTQGTFTQSGSTVTFNLGTIANGGTATVTVTAQATEDGTLTDSASVTSAAGDPTPGDNSASASTIVAEAPPPVVSAPITTTVSKFSGTVATFTHANGVEPASAFVATIAWGDGTTSKGTITLSGTTYTVTGTHHYKGKATTHTITTTVVESGTAPNSLLADPSGPTLAAGAAVPDLYLELAQDLGPQGITGSNQRRSFAAELSAENVP
jgi:uncharacterized repeat protein (TIGR01451 family)